MIVKLDSKTADSLGRTLDNLGKDILTQASGVAGVAGVGDSAEVYAITFTIYHCIEYDN